MDGESRRLVEEARVALERAAGKHLTRLVLFGSQARGDATSESDIDLLAIVADVDQQTVEAMRATLYEVMFAHNFARLLSLHVQTAAEFEDRLARGYSFARNVDEEGIVLWAA